jgi:RHS repeat-associated protein
MSLANAVEKAAVAHRHAAHDPFGDTLRSTGLRASANPWRFSTKYTDQESGWLYYGYRYYAPKLGRWVSRDPGEERRGLNLLAFTGNDTVRRWDVLGREIVINVHPEVLGFNKGAPPNAAVFEGGRTEADWNFTAEIHESAGCCWLEGEMMLGVSYWYYNSSYLSRKLGRQAPMIWHEEQHVSNWRLAWDRATSAIGRLPHAKMFSERGCCEAMLGLTGWISSLHRDMAEFNNLVFDFEDYDKRDYKCGAAMRLRMLKQGLLLKLSGQLPMPWDEYRCMKKSPGGTIEEAIGKYRAEIEGQYPAGLEAWITRECGTGSPDVSVRLR